MGVRCFGVALPFCPLAAAGFLAFSETGIGLGFVVPGETGVLVAATTVGTVPMFVAMSVVVWLSDAAGDSFGYLGGVATDRRHRRRGWCARWGARSGTGPGRCCATTAYAP